LLHVVRLVLVPSEDAKAEKVNMHDHATRFGSLGSVHVLAL
jgi:hypothetical protein